jgi:hypothetical protein
MNEVWLRPNRRAIWFGCAPPLLVALAGAWMAIGSSVQIGWMQWGGAALTAAGFGMVAVLLRQMRRPRIGYAQGQVLFYLQAGQPIAIPVKIVEAFFLGQGPALLPRGMSRKQQAVNVVARLAQRETQWARREVKPALGNWCDGYVTVRGTWCEPLNADVIRRLNHRLKEVKTSDGAVA